MDSKYANAEILTGKYVESSLPTDVLTISSGVVGGGAGDGGGVDTDGVDWGGDGSW